MSTKQWADIDSDDSDDDYHYEKMASDRIHDTVSYAENDEPKDNASISSEPSFSSSDEEEDDDDNEDEEKREALRKAREEKRKREAEINGKKKKQDDFSMDDLNALLNELGVNPINENITENEKKNTMGTNDNNNNNNNVKKKTKKKRNPKKKSDTSCIETRTTQDERHVEEVDVSAVLKAKMLKKMKKSNTNAIAATSAVKEEKAKASIASAGKKKKKKNKDVYAPPF